MSKVLIMNLDKVEKMILELPRKEEKVLSRNNMRFIKMVKKSAKLMAPRDTGELAESISARKTKTKGKTQQYLLEVTAPHAKFQEEGFTPHYAYVRNSSKLAPGVYFVKKNTPFVKPALERNIPRFFDRINKGIGRAVEI